MGLISAHSGKQFLYSELIEGYKYENVVTTTFNGTNIYLYNNVDFIFYESQRNCWFNVAGFKDVFAPSLSSLGNSLFMIGGYHYNKNFPMISKQTTVRESILCGTTGKSLKHYDVRENKWSELPQMKYARYKAASCIYNDVIYVSGGDDLAYCKNYNVEYYDIRAGVWSEFQTPMPRPKMSHCFVAHNDKLWFFGGQKLEYSYGAYDLSWYCYNLKENIWSEIFSLPTPQGGRKIERIQDATFVE